MCNLHVVGRGSGYSMTEAACYTSRDSSPAGTAYPDLTGRL